MFRALRSQNYRYFFYGQILSLTGTWISSTAQGWLIFRLTGSESWLGFVNFAQQFPALIVGLITGVIADRVDKLKILFGTQFFSMLQSFGLAWVVWIWLPAEGSASSLNVIIALAIFQGVLTGFDMPARQSLTPLLVQNRSDLPNAIALNAAMFNSARLIGPVIAGGILAVSNEAVCFFLDGLSFLAVLFALTKITIVTPPSSSSSAPSSNDPTASSASFSSETKNVGPTLFWTEFKEGIMASFGDSSTRRNISLIAGIGLFGITPVVLMPVIAKVVFGGGAELLGLLLGASGFGALIGSLILASRRPEALERVLRASSLGAAVGMLVLSQSTSLYITFPFIFIVGMSIVLVVATCSTLIQMSVDDRVRGRVSSVFTMTWLGSMPVGALLMGFVAEHFGVPTALLLSGAALSAMYLGIQHKSAR